MQGEARQKFLDQACQDNRDLRREADQFIATYEADRNFLEQPALPGFTLEQTAGPVHRIGAYRIIRPIGKGGMGEVFLAQREEGPLSHPVALKLMRAGQDEDHLISIRFQVEQQILSELTHPNIARMLDAGTSDDGRPYFVMDYVDGIPITDYCDQHQLSIDERLTLFLQVCEAVQFAHQHLIVHRDLKPGNLLVTESGQVKLLDFGIAKALSPWQAGVSALNTQTGFRVMTPAYASPEQVKGEPITTSSDVYSLGVLLYEMLTGRRPYRLAAQLEAEVVRVITEEEPLRPSDVVTQHFEKKEADGSTTSVTPALVGAHRQTTTERLQRKLKGELDHIVLMALRKEPPRRYRSAAGLGEDIRRHLSGLPVEAQPDTLRYRAGKFVRRHQWGVGAAVALVLLLLSFSTVTAVQSTRIRTQSVLVTEERDRARAEAMKADRVVQILVDLFETANPQRVPGGDTLRVDTFLKRGESKVLQDLDDQPEIQARMKHVLGNMYRAQGNGDRAEALLRDALAQQRTLKGADDVTAIVMLRNLASVLWRQGRRDTSLVLFREAEARLRRSHDAVDGELATTLLAMAPRLSLGEREDKERMLLEANALIDGLPEPTPMQRASAANQLGVFYYNQGAYTQAKAPFEKALRYLEQAVGPSHPHYLVTAGNLAGVLTTLNQLDEAEQWHRLVLQKRREQNAQSVGVAFSLSQLGYVFLQKGAWNEAEAAQAEAHALITALDGIDHPRWASYALAYAAVLIHQQQFEEAENLIQQALVTRQRHFGANSVEVAEALRRSGTLLRAQGQWEDALQRLHEALNLLYIHYPDSQHTSIASAELAKGVIHLKQDRVATAHDAIQRALVYRQNNESSNKPYLAEAQVWAGVALSRLGRHQEAAPLLQEGRPLFDQWVFTTEENRQTVRAAHDATNAALHEE